MDLLRDFAKIRDEVDGLPYFHWDELRHRSPPAGLDLQAWWTILKVARTFAYVDVELRDAAARPFRFAMTNQLQRRIHELDRVMTGALRPPPGIRGAMRDTYLLASLREEAITSSQLEGAATTREVAIEMLRSERAPRTQGERMIANNYAAMQWIRAQVSRPLTRDSVIELQRILTDGAIDVVDGSGRLRHADERITVQSDGEVVHIPPPAEELEARIETMCAFANAPDPPGAFVHPILRAIALHFWLAYDHPFVDGNGRVARALFYWSMARHGYWLSGYLSISRILKKARAQYMRALLHAETDDNDATYFIVHQLSVLDLALNDLHTFLARKAQQSRHAEDVIRVCWTSALTLNERQLALLAHAVRTHAASYTVESHRASHGVAYQTARTDLLSLARDGLLEKRKRGNKFVFVPSHQLQPRVVERP